MKLITTIVILTLVIAYLINKWMEKPKYKTNCYICNRDMILTFDSKGACLVCKECEPELKQKLDIKPHKDYAPTKRV